MKDAGAMKPQGMKLRQSIQDAVTNTFPQKIFSEDNIDLVELDIVLDNLGWNFHDYRILYLCDIHLGQWINPHYLDDLTDYINTLNYDLIALGGDYFSYIFDAYDKVLEKSFKKLKAPDGKFGVLGNHDHWIGAYKIRDIFKKSGVYDLSNDVFVLSGNGDKLNLCGVDSSTVCFDDIDLVISKLEKDTPGVLLSHEPDFALESSKSNLFHLQISGHSHGGQFIIPKFKTTPFRGPNSTKYPVGLYKVGNMIQYTSKGLGTNSFRIRINCKPEITLITLKTNKKLR